MFIETDYSKSILSAVTRDEEEEKTVADSATAASTSPNSQEGTDEVQQPEIAKANTTNGDAQEKAATTQAAESNPVVAANHQANEDLPPTGKVNIGDEPPPSGTVNTGDEQPPKGSVNGGDTPPTTGNENENKNQ